MMMKVRENDTHENLTYPPFPFSFFDYHLSLYTMSSPSPLKLPLGRSLRSFAFYDSSPPLPSPPEWMDGWIE